MSVNQDAQKLIDEANAILETTTVGYAGHGAAWKANPTTAWSRGRAKLAQARALLDPPVVTPPPSGFVVAAPQGPLTDSPPIYLPTNLPGLTAKKRVMSSETDGLRLMKWPPAASTDRYTLRDLQVDHVAAVPPRSQNGTKEAGFWIGQAVNAYRLLAKDCAWMGMWTGCMCDGSHISDFELLGMPHVGLYLEHVTRNTLFGDFRIEILPGAAAEAAVKSEWWYRNTTYGPLLNYGGLSGSYNNTFDGFELLVPPGVWPFRLEPGTFGNIIRNGRIVYTDPSNPGNLGISHPKTLVDPSKPNLIDWASIEFVGQVGERDHVDTNPVGS
jgi:hypothetical protein